MGAVRDLRRSQIVDAARLLVADGGLDALTFAALERRLDFTRGVITHHFENKQAIVDALLADAIMEIDAATMAALGAVDDSEDRVHAVIRSMVGGFLRRPEATRVLIAFWGRVGHDPHVSSLNAALYRRYRQSFRELVAAGQESGELRADLDEEAVSALVVGIVIGIAAQAHFEEAAIDVARAVEAGAAAVYLLIS